MKKQKNVECWGEKKDFFKQNKQSKNAKGND